MVERRDPVVSLNVVRLNVRSARLRLDSRHTVPRNRAASCDSVRRPHNPLCCPCTDPGLAAQLLSPPVLAVTIPLWRPWCSAFGTKLSGNSCGRLVSSHGLFFREVFHSRNEPSLWPVRPGLATVRTNDFRQAGRWGRVTRHATGGVCEIESEGCCARFEQVLTNSTNQQCLLEI